MATSDTQTSVPAQIDIDHDAKLNPVLRDDISAYTESPRSSIMKGMTENGRRYHSYRSGANYSFPEDGDEQDRLDLQHDLFLRSMGSKLFFAPVEKNVHDVLDLGTGTGIWAVEFADQYPEASVTGTDLSPIQPSLVPPNCKFIVDDFEDDWVFQQKFDFIHGRMLVGGMKSPKSLFQEAYETLKPGGWFEMQDACLPISDENTISPESAYQRWLDLQAEALGKGLERDWNWAREYKDWMAEVGFKNVEQKDIKWPQNTWPKDPQLKELGMLNIANLDIGLEGFTLRLFSGVLGMSREDIEVLLAGVRKDMVDPNMHTYWPV